MIERALEKLKNTEVRLKRITDNTPNTLQKYQKAGIVKDGLMKNLEEAIQSLLDACAIIIKEKDLGIPSEDKGYVDLLETSNILSETNSKKLHQLRGLRNRLVHTYGEIDDKKIYENLTEKLGDFNEIINELRKTAKK